MSNCNFSGSDGVPQLADGLSVQCPLCGAIRQRVVRTKPKARFVFAQHKPLDGTAQECDHWELLGNNWAIARKVKRT